jgi:hemoglobin
LGSEVFENYQGGWDFGPGRFLLVETTTTSELRKRESEMVKNFILAVCLLTVIGASAMAGTRNHRPVNPATGPATAGGQEKKSLYSRLGGYDAVAAVVDDFIGRLVADKRFAKFFVGHSEDSLKKIRQHIVDQFCAAAGGPCLYTGRDMKTSHKGLGITEDDWNAAATHLVASIDKFKVPKAEKDDLLAFVTSLKKDIVEK